jgi:hypothetical protein
VGDTVREMMRPDIIDSSSGNRFLGDECDHIGVGI